MNNLVVAINISEILGLMPDQFDHPSTIGQLVSIISEEYAKRCPANPRAGMHEKFYHLAKGRIRQQSGDSRVMLGSEPYILSNGYGRVEWFFCNDGLLFCQRCHNNHATIYIGFIGERIRYYLLDEIHSKMFEIDSNHDEEIYTHSVYYRPGRVMSRDITPEVQLLFYNLVAADEQLIKKINSSPPPIFNTGYDGNLEFRERIVAVLAQPTKFER